MQVFGLKSWSPEAVEEAGPGALRADAGDRSVRRRVQVAWAFLFLNVLPFQAFPTLVRIPHKMGQVVTQGALVVALIVIIELNPKARFRPNVLLSLYTVLAIFSAMMSLRFVSLGTDIRTGRLLLFVGCLWLLSPFWGRDDLLLLTAHRRALLAVLSTVVVGALVAHHKAFSQGHRLSGAIWPIPPTQVAHYAGEVAAITLLLFLCGLMSRRSAAVVVPVMFVVLLLSHTRTALVAAVVGFLVACLSLLTSRRRIRMMFAGLILALALAGPVAAPLVTSWLTRGQSSQELTQLTGRTKAWDLVVHDPRPETNVILGSGLSNEAIQGMSIDSTWLSTYMDQGIVGDVLVASILLFLIVKIGFAPPGPGRAVAVFLVTYVLIASFTEDGVANATTYALDLTVAASLLLATGRPAKGELPLFESPSWLRRAHALDLQAPPAAGKVEGSR